MKLDLKKRIRRPFFWVGVLLALSVIFGFIFKFTGASWAYWGAVVPWGPLGLFILVGIVFAFIINPIRALIAKIKEKKEDKG